MFRQRINHAQRRRRKNVIRRYFEKRFIDSLDSHGGYSRGDVEKYHSIERFHLRLTKVVDSKFILQGKKHSITVWMLFQESVLQPRNKKNRRTTIESSEYVWLIGIVLLGGRYFNYSFSEQSKGMNKFRALWMIFAYCCVTHQSRLTQRLNHTSNLTATPKKQSLGTYSSVGKQCQACYNALPDCVDSVE